MGFGTDATCASTLPSQRAVAGGRLNKMDDFIGWLSWKHPYDKGEMLGGLPPKTRTNKTRVTKGFEKLHLD